MKPGSVAVNHRRLWTSLPRFESWPGYENNFFYSFLLSVGNDISGPFGPTIALCLCVFVVSVC